ASPTIRNNLFTLNTALGTPYGGQGGGIYSKYTSVIIEDNLFSGNSSGMDGGGIYCEYPSDAQISNNTFTENSCESSGGGIYIWQGPARVEGNTVVQNHSGSTGGGIYCMVTSAVIADNLIAGNDTVNTGGGISVQNCEDLELASNIISDNSANPAYDGGGGGIYWHYSDGCIKNNTISNNTTLLNGGGICLEHASPVIVNNSITENSAASFYSFGGGIYSDFESAPEIRGNRVADNTTTGSGGGLCVSAEAPPIEGNLICGNQATDGAGIMCFAPSMLINNMIIGNHASDTGGGASIYYYDAVLVNNTFSGNEADLEGGGLFCHKTCMKIANSLFWNNSAIEGPELCLRGSSDVEIKSSDLKGGQAQVSVDPGCSLNWGAGMIDIDPLFVSAVNRDGHLFFNSPCKDTGDNAAAYLPAQDLEGDPRVAFGTVDIGADEFHPHLYYTGEATPGGSIEIKIAGLPGTDPVGVFLGSGVLETPLNTAWGEYYLEYPWFLVPLFPVPADGVLILPVAVPALPAAPYDLPMQALIGLGSNTLSNLCLVTVRA
ncbi:MAG: NosD domain-containing protein, partial [Planctomycetota bacterium]